MLYYNGKLELSPAQDKQTVKDILAKNGLVSMPVPGFNGSFSMSVLGLGSAIDFWDYRSSAAISEQMEKVCLELRALGTNISGVLRFYGDDDGYVFVNEDGSVEVTDEEHGIIRCANTEDLVAELERRGYKVEKTMDKKTKIAIAIGKVLAAKDLKLASVETSIDQSIDDWAEELEGKNGSEVIQFVKSKLDQIEASLPKDTLLGRELNTHESYGLLSFSRTSHGGDCHLFGSDIGHRNTIQMSIKRARHRRDLHTDWYYGGTELLRVEMSGSQFAEAISCMNMGDGVPVTLNRVMGLRMDDPPFVSKADLHRSEFENEVREVNEKMKELISEVEELFQEKSFSKKAKEEILRKLDKLYQFSSSNEMFHVDSFQRMADQTVTAAKAEIEAFALNKVLTIGQQALVQNADATPALPTDVGDVFSISDGDEKK